MKRLLVTGGSGFLGWNVCRAASPAWSVHATVHRRNLAIPGTSIGRVDLTNFSELKITLDHVKPEAIIHLAAASQPNDCQEHPDETRRINVDASVNIAGLAADRGIPLAFISTDLVFDGRHSPYSETDPVSPISLYAEQKVDAERGVAERWPDAAICRMPLMFGDPGPTAMSFIQPFLKVMRAGQELKLFQDETRTPVSGAIAAAGILLALEHVHGLIHLGGRERITRFDFGRLMAEVLEIQTARIVACLQKDIPMAAPRPSDVSLDSTRAYALGYDPPCLKDQLAALKGVV